MFNKYYENELRKLREQAVEFSKAHPVTAPLLSGPSMDPGAERMLEGMAFLSGLLHQKLDDGLNDFIRETLEIIFPHFVRPIPATSIILFEHKSGQTTPVIVESGTLLSSNKLDGVTCQFQSLFNIEVNPLRVIAVEANKVREKCTQIEVSLELLGTNLSSWNPSQGLSFFLGGSYTQTTNLFMLLHHYLNRVILKVDGIDEEFILPSSALRAIGLELDNRLIDFPVQSFAAFRLLQEYFILPQKFTFMMLTGFDRWKNRGKGNKFSICFELNDIPESLPHVNKDTFIFNATPVVNLFSHEMEPIQLTHKIEKILLRPSTQSANYYQTYDIDSVISYQAGVVGKKEYYSMSSFRMSESNKNIYQLIRGRNPVNNNPEVYLFFPYQTSIDGLMEETLSVSLKCTNGRLPERLKVGDICKSTFNSPEALNFRNILQPTVAIEPPTDAKNLWKMVSHLSMNFLSITNLKNLKALLSIYLPNEDQDRPRLMSNQKRIEGIRAISNTSIDRISRGRIMRGHQINMDVDVQQFTGLGDVYLFGALMDNFFSSYASMNIFTQFNLKEVNTGVTFKWAAKIGNKILV